MIKTILKGTTKQKVYQMLQKAGWFPGRKVPLAPILEYYQKRNIQLPKKAIAFLEEFYGITPWWYIMYLWKIEGTSREGKADFCFHLFPYPQEWGLDVRDFMFDDAEFVLKSEEYKSVINASKEYVVMVGEIGYHYPARVWIGESGKIYCSHDYEEKIHIFDSVVQLMLYELPQGEIQTMIID